MKFFYNKILSFYKTIEGKIAFYPSLMAFIGFNFALLMLYLEDRGISSFVFEYVPELVINNPDTAKTLLSFLTGGIISIMVFSFSMVMVLLNQASSNFSPRVLPDLISNKKHQYVLGAYLATILYNTFTLVGINPKEDAQYQLPGFSVLIGIILTVVCFGSFLYFIHSISQAIQVNNILDSIYLKAKTRLLRILEIEDETPPNFPDTSNWNSYYSNQTGYFQKFAVKNLLDICEEENIKIKILPVQGIFVLKGIPIIQVNKEINEELVKKILSNFNFARGEFVEDNYALAFKQITEIGVKAMSPGINDPGTAINTIDYLTELFAYRLKKNDRSVLTQNDKALIYVTTVNFAELFYQVMVSYRTYCKGDMSCIQKLFMMISYLLQQECQVESYKKNILKEAEELYNDATDTIKNKYDLEKLTKLYENLSLQAN
jgi:uncharacterized membrane protein